MSAETVEQAKKLACIKAVDTHVTASTRVIGIGSGSTIPFAVDRLAKRFRNEGLPIVACIPTSFQAQGLIVTAGLPLATLNQYPEVDVAFDGADEVDANLHCIKGGGACLLEEKLVASNARLFVLLADYRKESDVLGKAWRKGLPIEVVPSAYVAVEKKIFKQYGAVSRLRMGISKAGPVVTDHGNFILDVDFGNIENPRALHTGLISIPGVIETGLFCDMASYAYFGMADGSVKVVEAKDVELRQQDYYEGKS